jgi:transcriptional regulator with XRE-family HTH domain
MPPSARSPQPAKALLAVRDITNAQIASDLGYSVHWVGRVLNGHVHPSDEFAGRLADYLNLPVADLFVDDPDDVVISFVRRTTTTSGVPEGLSDVATAEKVAAILKGGGAHATA